MAEPITFGAAKTYSMSLEEYLRAINSGRFTLGKDPNTGRYFLNDGQGWFEMPGFKYGNQVISGGALEQLGAPIREVNSKYDSRAFTPTAPSGQSTQNVQPQDYSNTQISRDQNDNFYVDGKHINLEQFKALGINADFVPRGSTVNIGQAQAGNTTTSPNLLGVVKETLDKLYDKGYTINPNANIGGKSLDEFLAIAGAEIDPYYATQLKLASDELKKSLGYSEQQLLQAEGDLERKYGRGLRELGETSAEQGFAQSGLRKREEQELASETQKAIETGRRTLGFQAGQQVGQFAQQYGGMAGFNLPGRTLPGMPTVRAGETQFARGGQSNYYELSPEVYSGLVGEQEFARRGAIQTRASELEGAQNTALSLNRSLNT